MEILLIALVLGCIPGAIAQSKGRSFVGWWLYGAALFIIALPHALIIGRKEQHRTDHAPAPAPAPATPTKKCPMCAELVQADARICRYCRHEFGTTTAERPAARHDFRAELRARPSFVADTDSAWLTWICLGIAGLLFAILLASGLHIRP